MQFDNGTELDCFYPGTPATRPPLGISACLTGQRVRYDGRDKYLPGISDWLQQRFTLLPVCPEVEAGLPVPRPPVRLLATAAGPRAVGRDDPELDCTDALTRTAATYSAGLTTGLCGVVLKSRSPSCGWGSTPVLQSDGSETMGSGLFARQLERDHPWLVLQEETGLATPHGRQQFLSHCLLVADAQRAQRENTLAHLAQHYGFLAEDARAAREAGRAGDFAALVVILRRGLTQKLKRAH